MILLPSYIEGIFFGRRRRKKSKMQIVTEKGKEKKKKRNSQVILIGGEHLPAASRVPRGPSTHAASQALSQPAGAAVLGEPCFLEMGVCILLLAKGELEGSSSSGPWRQRFGSIYVQ